MPTDEYLFENVPGFAFFKDLEEELGVPPHFFRSLLKEDDWSFVIKLHALLEAAVTQLLTESLGEPGVRHIVSRLELSNLTTGKLAFVKSLGLLDSDAIRFIQKLSEIRNQFVHNINNVSISLEGFFANLELSDRKGYYKAFKWGYINEESVIVQKGDLYDIHEMIKLMAIEILEDSPKVTIWLGSIIILRTIYGIVTHKRVLRQIKQLDDQILTSLKRAILGDETEDFPS